MDDRMTVAVYGATGHTGRFVVAELARRGLQAIRIGRDAARLAKDGSDATLARVAAIDDPAALDAALRGAAAVINCAGPYLDTALPLADAALRAGIPYLDLTAEQPSVLALAEHCDARARAAGVTLVPAAAFYGGLADLLVTAVVAPNRPIERVDIATGLDSWHPTHGTRVTGERNRAVRLVQKDGKPAPVEVRLGISDGSFTELLEGLKEGDEVIAEAAGGSEGGAGPNRRGQQGGGFRRIL